MLTYCHHVFDIVEKMCILTLGLQGIQGSPRRGRYATRRVDEDPRSRYRVMAIL